MRDRRTGSAFVEVALMMPWLAFLFVGVLDFGFYSYAAIATQNAARAAAVATSADSSSQTNAITCAAALSELRLLPNLNGVTTCVTGPGGITDAQPVAASVVPLSAGSTPPCADCGAPGCTDCRSSQVTITYRTVPMIPIPGILMSRMTLTRIAEMRVLRP